MHTKHCRGEHTSEEFNVGNGVKQGGVLSPVLFSLYIDGLFDCLANSQWGCHTYVITLWGVSHTRMILHRSDGRNL